MWGITGRGARLGEGRRSRRVLEHGVARMAVRGPIEHAVLEIGGELDFSAVRRVVEAAAGIDHRIVSIDLAALEFIDVEGARALERIRRDRARRHGERPALIGVTPAVERSLRLVRSRRQQVLTR